MAGFVTAIYAIADDFISSKAFFAAFPYHVGSLILVVKRVVREEKLVLESLVVS